MAQLDKLVEKLQRNEEIVLEAGKAPMLKTKTGSTLMFNQQISPVQLSGLLQEIAPAALKATVSQQKPARFEYTFGAKTVVVIYAPESDQVSARIMIAGSAADPGGDTQAPVE